MISEIARFLSTLLAAVLIDAYILWDVQNASRVCLAIGINIVVIIGYCISYESRSNDVPRDRPRSIRDRTKQQDLD